MPLKLVGTHGGQSFDLREGAPLVVGRALGSDVPVVDPTISRRHAELRVEPEIIRVLDLGSVNGTFLNGARLADGVARVGDVITFGRLSFRVEPGEPPKAVPEASSTDGATIVRQRPVGERRLGDRRAGSAPTPEATTPERVDTGEPDLNARKLAVLLDVARTLGRAAPTDTVLERIAEVVFDIMDVDRVAVLLASDADELVPSISRDRWGTGVARVVPRSIARTVREQRVAVLTDNAPEDRRFDGQSIVAQRVRSAMCAPLIGSEGRVLGVLYVDSLTATHRFGDEDLDFLAAFSGIAAVAIENGTFAERIRREALVRASFERYFAPALAARIAASPADAKLGGERHRATVLFSDLRGFTALSATMSPEATAQVLNEYLGAMTECVFRHGGVLDKFLGDGVMAQWGAPIESADDTAEAIAAAIDMQTRLRELNARWRAEGGPELAVGIGVDRGEVFAGNIGSERRLEYTVIGDAVNIAARLCDCAAGGEILVSEAVASELRDGVRLDPLEPLTLKGTGGPHAVFRVLP
jgi:adenylate cyclase